MQTTWLRLLCVAVWSIFVLTECKNNSHKQGDPLTTHQLKKSAYAQGNFDCTDNGTMPNVNCPQGTIYDVDRKKCIRDWQRKKRTKRQTEIVGVPCQENIDCQTTSGGSYCDTTKRCDCLPQYVNIFKYCWPKANPGESCQYNDQCTGTSPNTLCDSSGQCKCMNNQPATYTDDGPVCIVPGECPTNGANSKLKDPLGGTDVPCPMFGAKECKDPSPTATSTTGEGAYDCLCPTVDIEESECGTGQSYCCPRRAMACIQPKDEGNYGFGGAAAGSRWWYNSASANCESLAYRGSGGNGNNFQSKALCESYCKTACLRGNPVTKPWKPRTEEVTKCSATVGCANPDTSCELSKGICCYQPDYICGLKTTSPASPNSGDLSYNVRNVTRYHFATDRCLPFPYYGIGGNFNNFQTQAECQAFCSRTQCPAGEPLRNSMGDIVLCGVGCPAKYTCTPKGACCPSTDFVCNQERAVGGCSSFSERWWFNPTTRSCEQFHYSGCHGNYNNFPSYQECSSYCGASKAQIKCPQGEAAKDSTGTGFIICSGGSTTSASTTERCPSDYYCYFDGTRYGCCPTRTKTCTVDYVEPGTSCITSVTRWYYNTVTRQCDVFTYSGCDGNSNNFATKIDCQDYCGVGGCPEGGEPFRDVATGGFRACGQSSGLGASDCPSGFACTIVTLGTTTRRNYCCPTRVHVCSLPQDGGQRCGTHTLNRFYFNPVSKTCESFNYNGCLGNRNNFASVQQCLTYCNSAGCQAGQVALQDAGTKLVTTCDFNVASSCASGYTCIFSQLLKQGICCGSTAPEGSCQLGQSAYMDSFTNTPLQCTPNVEHSCPNGIFCQYSYTLQNSFCCHTPTAQCAQGGSPYVDSTTNRPTQCTPGLPNVCPTGYTCQATSVVIGGVTSTTGYCCGQPNICGTGYAPYYVSNQAVPCVLTQFPTTCPSPYSCRQDPSSHQSYCCVVSTQLVAVCPVGKTPLLNRGAPTLCTQTSPSTGCPGGYTCDLYAATGSYYCCVFGSGPLPTSPPIGAVCPAPNVLLVPIQTCSPGVLNSCPRNYFCSYDATGLRYVCCGSGAVIPPVTNPCPSGQPYVNPASGQAQVCVLGSTSTGCPAPYGCAYSTAMRNYYCCSGVRPPPVRPTVRPPFPTVRPPGPGDAYGCPFGSAYVYPGTRTPLSCSPNTGPTCPVGYSCQRSNRANTYQCCSSMLKNTRVNVPAVKG